MKIRSISKFSAIMALTLLMNPQFTHAGGLVRLAKTVIIFAGGFLTGDYYANKQEKKDPVVKLWSALKEKAGFGQASLTDKVEEVKISGEHAVEAGKEKIKETLGK